MASVTQIGFPNDGINDDDQGVDALIRGMRWTSPNVTFAFPQSQSDYSSGYYDSAAVAGFTPLSNQQEVAVRAGLQNFADVSLLNFTELFGSQRSEATMHFAQSSAPSTAYAYYPNQFFDVGGDVWFGTTYNYTFPIQGTYAYQTIIHEAGHALGLKHGQETDFGGAIPYDQDSLEYSVMTYRSYVGAPLTGYTASQDSYPQTIMMLDIAATQRLYGANFNYQSGDTVYTFTSTGDFLINDQLTIEPNIKNGNKIFRTIWDGNGEDTYNFSSFTTNLAIDLTAGGYNDLDVGGNALRANLGRGNYARGHVFNALQVNDDPRSLIENVEAGRGNDTIKGNQADNTINGRAGNDTIEGGLGDDIINGNNGTDTAIFDGLLSNFSFAFESLYTVTVSTVSGIDWGIDTVLNVEWFQFSDVLKSANDLYDEFFVPETTILADYSSSATAITIDLFNDTTGGGAAGDDVSQILNIIGSDGVGRDYIYGDENDNIITALAGADIIDGGAGADDIDGGEGWDVMGYTRSGEAVNLNFLTDTYTGGHATGDTLTRIEGVLATSYNDIITSGNAGLWVRAGFGDDTLISGANADRFFGEGGNDTYIFTTGQHDYAETTGLDTVVFDAIWSPDDATINGNVLTFDPSSIITFNDITAFETFRFSGYADMTLEELVNFGAGGSGTTTGTGGADIFTATAAAEAFDGLGGVDTIDYRNSAEAVIVNLQTGAASGGFAEGDTFTNIESITGSDNTARDRLNGDDGANTLQGLNGADILEGGLGADILDGGDGWDTAIYARSTVGVTVNMNGSAGSNGDAQGDILLNIEAILGSAYDDVLNGGDLADFLRGSHGNDDILGGAGRDTLFGDSGADTLYGGAGADTLYGGAGGDLFIFDDAAYTGVDRLYDFSTADGDQLSVADLITGFDPLTDAINDFISITESGSNTTLSVDSSGGGDNFTAVATLYNTTGLGDADDLLQDGHLVV